jgi:hypothetical protein
MPKFLAVALMLVAMSCEASGPPMPKQITDADIVALASKPFKPPQDRIPDTYVLGIHNGVKVIVEFRCGDVCPQYTSRHIHYDAVPGLTCDKIGGRVRTETLVQGIGVVRKDFCVPAVLVEKDLH